MLAENLFKIGLFFTFCSSLSLAVYVTAHFRNGLKVHLLHTICTFLGLWSLGLLLVRVAPTYQEALFWQRLSALGWTTIYSLLLHFSLTLTESHLLKRWWLYPLVYFPAFLNLLIFSLLPGFAGTAQQLLQVNSGWVVLPRADFWNWFFNLYCVSFTVISGALFLRWARKLHKAEQRRMGFTVALSLFSSVALGVFLDRTFSPRYFAEFSNLAPIIALFPVTVLSVFFRTQQEFLGIKRRSFSCEVTRGEVLSEADKLSLYAHLAGVHILGGFLYVVISVLLLDRSLEAQAFLWGALFFLVGVGIYYLCAWETSEKRRDLWLGVALSLSAFLIFLRAAPLLKEQPLLFLPLLSFLLPTILVGNFGAFVVISVALSLMQVWAWFNLPLSGVFSSSMLFVAQLLVTVVFALFVLLVFYIRNVYLRRLEENRAQLDAQQTVARLSAQLVGMQPSSLEKGLESVLRELLKSHGMDCGCFFVFNREGDLRCKVHLGGEASGFTCRDSQESRAKFLSALKEIAKNEEIFVVGDIKKLPLGQEQFAGFFEKAGMRSVIVLPIQRGERLLGILALGALRSRTFSAYQEESLKILGRILADVLERVEAELELQHMAFYDALTELPNRTLFMDRLQKALQLARRTGKLVAVVFVDLDSFKVINDSEGHEMGDRLLKEVAQRFVSSIREYDTVARFGGDEFLLLVDNLGDPQEVVPIAERLLHRLQQPFFVGKQEFFLTASCGVAIYPLDAETPEELIRFADLAMYAAKTRGGGCYAFCSQELREEAQQKKVLVSGLYRALDRKELIVYYQPQVDAATGNIVGVEALLRWVHPELGFLLPDSFIPLAEQTGLIIPIGEWVLQTACSQLAAWRKKGLRIHRVAVNLSPSQLRDPQLTDKVRKAVEKAGIFPDELELEVTESAVFQNPDEIIDLLQELKTLGVRVALDDFGVGYSSLIRLKMLPVDRIKVDRRFFRDIPSNRRDAAIVENIIQLARSINAAVIAEGVENDQQLEFVVDRGCYEIQGYYYYHPLPPEEVEALLLRTQDRKD